MDQIWRQRLHYSLAGQLCTMQDYFKYVTGAPDGAGLASLYDGDNLDDTWAATQPDDVVLLYAEYALVDGDPTAIPPAPYVVTYNTPGNRTSVADTLPPFICLDIRKRTAVGGKSHRSRTFWSGGLESDIDLNGWQTTTGKYVEVVDGYYTALYAALGAPAAAGWIWSTFSPTRFAGRPSPSEDAAYYSDDITNWSPDVRVHSLRTRR